MRPLPIFALIASLSVTTHAYAATLFLPSAAELDLDNDGTPELTVTTLHYNDTPAAPVTVGSTIPEPSTSLLLVFTILGAFIRRR